MSLLEHDDLAAGMRIGMRRTAQGVAVVSALSGSGARCAMTASSVTSVSMEPPSLLICVNQTASLFEVLAAQLPFCVNILSQGMEELANLCAGAADGEERFALGDWQRSADAGLPYLEDAEVVFFCHPVRSLHYGTHLICIADIAAVHTRDDAPNPLLYAAGAYRRLA